MSSWRGYHGHFQTRWTPAEDVRLYDLWMDPEISTLEVAERMGPRFTKNMCVGRAHRRCMGPKRRARKVMGKAQTHTERLIIELQASGVSLTSIAARLGYSFSGLYKVVRRLQSRASGLSPEEPAFPTPVEDPPVKLPGRSKAAPVFFPNQCRVDGCMGTRARPYAECRPCRDKGVRAA